MIDPIGGLRLPVRAWLAAMAVLACWGSLDVSKVAAKTVVHQGRASQESCARGEMHFEGQPSGELLPGRPTGAGKELERVTVNGNRMAFSTGGAAIRTIGGQAAAFRPTTITKWDPTGQAIRRLQKEYAPGLLTALRGVFEEPDGVGGWRAAKSFSSSGIRTPTGGRLREVPTGTYELQAEVNGQAFPIRLELLPIEERPWGRLTVVAGRPITAAVRGLESEGATWRFAVGGPVRSLELTFGDSVTGALSLGGGPPIPLRGGRASEEVDSADELRAHHALTPLNLAPREVDLGVSFTAATDSGALVYASHGPDLSNQTLVVARPGDLTPEILALSGTHSDRSPAVLPDGSGLVFASDRPLPDGEAVEGYRLWIAPRAADGRWDDPQPVVIEGRWDHDARQPFVAADGTLYFSSNAPDGLGERDIYTAEPRAFGSWASPQNLGAPVNSADDEHGVFVAPDGTYLILVSARSHPRAPGGDDLYISRPGEDGWSPPQPLILPVNTFANEYGPLVSRLDGRLYFTSDRYGYARIFRVEPESVGLPELQSRVLPGAPADAVHLTHGLDSEDEEGTLVKQVRGIFNELQLRDLNKESAPWSDRPKGRGFPRSQKVSTGTSDSNAVRADGVTPVGDDSEKESELSFEGRACMRNMVAVSGSCLALPLEAHLGW